MKYMIAALLLFVSFHAYSQTGDLLAELYKNGKYEEALTTAKGLLDDPARQAAANDIIGRIYVEQEDCQAAIPYLVKAIELDGDKTYISGWSHAYLGKAYLKTGKVEAGKAELLNAVRLHITNNSVKYAQRTLNMAELEPRWTTIETTHMIFKFQDTAGWGDNIPAYIDGREQAYENIEKVFQADLKKKITYYVWNDQKLARIIFQTGLGFSDPRDYTCNVHRNQTRGHELTHVISYWGWGRPSENITGLINEGVAVAFDQQDDDKYARAKEALKDARPGSIADIWKAKGKAEDFLYPVGGAFLTYLYEKSTADQFRSIIKNQSIENAEKTYGKEEFDKLVSEFDNMMGLK